MSTLYLIRHAQASMFAADYDRLSPLGEAQARRLGEVLADRLELAGRSGFDAVYCGPARRHRDTAALAGERLRARGIAFPEPIELAETQEHAGQELVIGVLATANAEQLELADRARDATLDLPARTRAWQVLYETTMRRWLQGEVAADGVETWPEFRARVLLGYERIRKEARGEVLLFTSVGPKAVILRELLELSPVRAFETAWRLYNTSISRVIYSGERATLDGFNDVAHLPLEQWTHR